MLDKSTVVGWFVSRAKPNALQFASWILNCWFKGEKIPAADVEGLDIYLGASVPPIVRQIEADGAIQIPARYAVHKIYFTPTGDSTISITANGVTYIEEQEFAANVMDIINIDVVAIDITALEFTGITSSTKIQIQLNKI